MATKFLNHLRLGHRSTWIYLALTNIQKLFSAIVYPQPISLEYQQWCKHLLRQRFWLGVGLAVIYMGITGLVSFYALFIDPEQISRTLERNISTDWLGTARLNFILHKVTFISLLGVVILFWKSRWGHKHPEFILVLLPWAIAFIPEMVLGAFFRVPREPSVVMFMAQAVLAPIFWRLHLLAQAIPLSFYFLTYPLIGLVSFKSQFTYGFSYAVELVLICIICEIGVYLYEHSKQSELEANRQLQLCIHTIAHDLRTPVMGSLILLQSIRQTSLTDRPIEISQAEMAQLIQGSDRLLDLMNSLLVPQALSSAAFTLHRQPTALSAIVTLILQDFHSSLVKQNIQIHNRIQPALPLVNVDAQQIGRVFHNLIGNVISHNPPGVSLMLDAARSHTMLKVTVQDNGVGISHTQQKAIFEPYMRGRQNQYLPGLGLGLYICRQVILAHGGTIGVESFEQGTMFWFTLPLSRV